MLKSILFICLIQTGLILSSKIELKALMPDVSPKTPDLYLCHKVKLDESQPVYITEFEAHATKQIAHHILLFACDEPGPLDTWNCGEMIRSVNSEFKAGPVCQSKQSIIFAWALDAPKLVLPKDVAFKLGGSTNNKYLVVQVHYANVDKFLDGSTDDSGIILKGQTEPVQKLAGVYLMGTGGQIQSHANERFETACMLSEDTEIHPFAYRTHAHKLALVNSGYLVRNEGEQTWTEIGRRSPQLPQMFYPVTNDVVAKKGDVLAARCTMYNFRDNVVRIGSTGNDEMCNFYIMYWVEGDKLLQDNICFSPGPPGWYFKSFKDGFRLDLSKIPEDASKVPEAQQEELKSIKAADGIHGMHNGMDHSKMDHSQMDHSKMDAPKTHSQNTDKIIELILRKYGSETLNNRYQRRYDSDENGLSSFEKAYLLKKIFNQIDLN